VISVSANLPGRQPADHGDQRGDAAGAAAGHHRRRQRSHLQQWQRQRRVTLQFDLNRNIDAAAREVQAAINARRSDLPSTLRSNPTYRKANPVGRRR
jgi:multidrug efflux pump